MATSSTRIEVDVKPIVMDTIKKYMSTVIDCNTAMDSLNIQVQRTIEYFGTQIVASWMVLKQDIAKDTYPAYFNYKTPLTWWDMLKKEHAPKWFKKRYPVKYKSHNIKRTVRFTRMATYPRANIAIPKDGPFFIQKLGGVESIEDKIEY